MKIAGLNKYANRKNKLMKLIQNIDPPYCMRMYIVYNSRD